MSNEEIREITKNSETTDSQAVSSSLSSNIQPDASLEAMLAEYHRRKTMEAMIGPAVSLAVHLLLFVCAFLIYSPQKPLEISASVEITSTEEEKPDEIEEMDELELPPPEEQVREVREVPVADVVEVQSEVNGTEIADSALNETVTVSEEAPAADFTNVLNVQSNKTNFKIAGLYASRSSAGRRSAANKYGGKISGESETAVVKALEWLKKTQNPDGSWGVDYKHAMAGLCLLTYLAHGEDTQSKRYGQTVSKAIQFLCDETIRYNGKPVGSPNPEYQNGIVAYALAEAYGMTRLPMIKTPMEMALKCIVEGQQKGGGFDYGYKKATRWDLSVAGWQYQALKAGYVAGADVKGLEKAIEKGISFLKNVCFKKPDPKNPGARPFGYETPGGGSDGMQGAGTLCLQLLGEGNSMQAKAGVKFINDVVLNTKKPKDSRIHWDGNWPIAGIYSNPVYYWYYCTQVMFHSGGSHWKDWHEKFTPIAMAKQDKEGWWSSPGTETKGKNGEKDGSKGKSDKWYTTALTALSLQVYYRYLPSYKLEKGKKDVEATELDKIDEELGF